jgi:dTDP-4-dehydrorhamnose 3,5-epimerase-like enzyme
MEPSAEKAAFARRDDRGTFLEVRNSGPWEAVIAGRMRAGAVMGNHYHRKTVVYFFLVRGAARVDIVDVETGERGRVDLPAEHGLLLPANRSHAIRFHEESDYILLKSRPYDPKEPDTYEHPVPG